MAAGKLWSRGEGLTPTALAMAGFVALSLWPDLDAIGFELGIPYGSTFGHRGATHSFLAALLAAGLVSLLSRRRARLFLFALTVAASHPLLDTLTDGGLGVALFWPVTGQRYFMPDLLRVIPVAPIGPRIFSLRGLYVTLVELVEFAPLWLWALIPRIGPSNRPTKPPKRSIHPGA